MQHWKSLKIFNLQRIVTLLLCFITKTMIIDHDQNQIPHNVFWRIPFPHSLWPDSHFQKVRLLFLNLERFLEAVKVNTETGRKEDGGQKLVFLGDGNGGVCHIHFGRLPPNFGQLKSGEVKFKTAEFTGCFDWHGLRSSIVWNVNNFTRFHR